MGPRASSPTGLAGRGRSWQQAASPGSGGGDRAGAEAAARESEQPGLPRKGLHPPNLERPGPRGQRLQLVEERKGSRSVVSNSLGPQRLFGCPTMLLYLWDSPGKSTGVGCHFLFQGIFPTQGYEPRSPALQADALPSEPPGNSQAGGGGEGSPQAQGRLPHPASHTPDPCSKVPWDRSPTRSLLKSALGQIPAGAKGPGLSLHFCKTSGLGGAGLCALGSPGLWGLPSSPHAPHLLPRSLEGLWTSGARTQDLRTQLLDSQTPEPQDREAWTKDGLQSLGCWGSCEIL